MRFLVIIVLLLSSFCLYCQTTEDSIFIKRKFTVENRQYIKYDTISYTSPNFPVQIIHGNELLKFTAGQSNCNEYGIYLDSISVENMGFDRDYFALNDSVVIEKNTDSTTVISIVVNSNMESMFFLFDMNTDKEKKEIQLWAYPYFLNKPIGPDDNFYRLRYYITKNPWLEKKRRKFRYVFKQITPYELCNTPD